MATDNSSPASDSLFVIDKVGNQKPLSHTQRKVNARKKILYVQRELQPLPKKKNKKKRKMNVLEKKYIERITNNNDEKTVKKRKLNDGSSMDFKSDDFFDIWNVKEEVKKIDGYEEDLVKNKNKKVNPFIWKKNNEIDAVEVVHPGASYNPSEEDHQVLLRKAVDEQVKKRKQFDVVMNSMKTKEDKRKIKELDEVSDAEDDNMSEDDNDPIKERVNIPIIPRKSTAERNREKRKKIHEANVMKNKLVKMRNSENLSNIIKEVKEENEEHNEIISNKKKLKEEKSKLKTKRVGKEKMGEKDVEVLLTDELPNSLRSFNPSTSLIEDRFHSLQKRNIIETRSIKNYNRRYPIKMKVNIRHREFATEQEKIYSS